MSKNFGETLAGLVTNFQETQSGVIIDTSEEPNKDEIHALVNAPGNDWKVRIIRYAVDRETLVIDSMKFYLSSEACQQFLAARQKQ